MINIHSYSCERCGKVKYAKYKSHIKRFCSHACANYGKSKGEYVKVECVNCSEVFTLLASEKRAREKNGNVIKFCSKKCEGEYRTVVPIKICPNCNVEFKPVRSSQKYCSRDCADKYIKDNGLRKRNGYWYENGYKVLYTEDGNGIKEHIKIMEDFIGRKLTKDEVVHHINEDKLDNRLENLQLMTRSEHSKLHRQLDIERGKKLFKTQNK